MKTGQSKLFRKLALNRRSNRINSAVYGGVNSNDIAPVPNFWKAQTISGIHSKIEECVKIANSTAQTAIGPMYEISHPDFDKELDKILRR